MKVLGPPYPYLYFQTSQYQSYPPLSDIFFEGPHDIWVFDTVITRYLRYIMTYNRCKVCQKNSAKRVICMSNTHNGTH